MRLYTFAAASAAALSCALGGSAIAGDEVLIRKSMAFQQCPAAIVSMLKSLNAEAANVTLDMDTGATYRVKLAASSANLIFQCNAVGDEIEVIRQTPGDLMASAE